MDVYVKFILVVDNAYACDPRIKKFKDEEKEKKLAEKKAKEEAARAVAEEKERVSNRNNTTRENSGIKGAVSRYLATL